jgi:DNA replication protein DnaC
MNTERKPSTPEEKALYNSHGILALWHDKEFEDFTGDREILKFIEEYVDEVENNISQSRGVLLTGTLGTGKTMLMNLSFKRFLKANKNVYITSFPNLVSQYTKNWRGEGILSTLMNAPFLGIDDIGKTFEGTQVSKDLTCAALDYILRYRVQSCRPTWLTANIPAHEFKTQYTPAIASLLSEGCILAELNGADQREKMFITVKAHTQNDTGESTLFNSRK